MWQKFLCRIGWHDWNVWELKYNLIGDDETKTIRSVLYVRNCLKCNRPDYTRVW